MIPNLKIEIEKLIQNHGISGIGNLFRNDSLIPKRSEIFLGSVSDVSVGELDRLAFLAEKLYAEE